MKYIVRNGYLYVCTILIVTFSLVSCNEGQNSNEMVSAPKEIISVDQAALLYNTYSERRVPIIMAYEKQANPNEGFQPTRFVMYDLQTVKNYIAYIEQEAKEANVEVNDLLFYTANYPENSVKNNRKNSLFIVPTTTLNGVNVGFLTTDSADGKRIAIPITDRLPKNMTGKNYLHSDVKSEKNIQQASFLNFVQAPNPGDRSLILNDGTLGPPPVAMGFGN